ncbi:MAG: hypothetical protein EOQ47_11285 [Mesorhizobium sp.]|nr:MAG: hypothetical protein EOQ47_11285 [Mesorhizobium sp.]
MGKTKKNAIEKAEGDELTAEAYYYARKCGLTPDEAMEIIRGSDTQGQKRSHKQLRPAVLHKHQQQPSVPGLSG